MAVVIMQAVTRCRSRVRGMGGFQYYIDTLHSITICTAHGNVDAEDILHHIENYFPQNFTEHILWNFLDASIDRITEESFKEIALLVKTLIKKRHKGKTAFVCLREVEFGLASMYEHFAREEGLPYEYKVFHHISEAMQWLKQ